MTMREKKILALGLLKSKKKIGGNHAFFTDNINNLLSSNNSRKH